MIRNFGNKLGLAWWAEIETEQPSCTYWFGPFITKRNLKENISSFIKDLSDEGSKNIKHSFVRCKKDEPLTVVNNNETRILWNGPKNWLLVSRKKELLKNIIQNFQVTDFAVTDLSNSRAIIEIEGQDVKEEELKNFCRQHLAGFKMPKTFIFQILPKTSTGKIQKFELRNIVKKL